MACTFRHWWLFNWDTSAHQKRSCSWHYHTTNLYKNSLVQSTPAYHSPPIPQTPLTPTSQTCITISVRLASLETLQPRRIKAACYRCTALEIYEALAHLTLRDASRQVSAGTNEEEPEQRWNEAETGWCLCLEGFWNNNVSWGGGFCVLVYVCVLFRMDLTVEYGNMMYILMWRWWVLFICKGFQV